MADFSQEEIDLDAMYEHEKNMIIQAASDMNAGYQTDQLLARYGQWYTTNMMRIMLKASYLRDPKTYIARELQLTRPILPLKKRAAELRRNTRLINREKAVKAEHASNPEVHDTTQLMLPWQIRVAELSNFTNSNNRILFVVGKTKGQGKSWMAQYLHKTLNSNMYRTCCSDDLLPSGNITKYSVLDVDCEECDFVYATFYKHLHFNDVNVIVFCNFFPTKVPSSDVFYIDQYDSYHE